MSDGHGHATTFQVHDCAPVAGYSVDGVVQRAAQMSALLDNLGLFLPKSIGTLSAGLYTHKRSGDGVTSLVSILSEEDPIAHV